MLSVAGNWDCLVPFRHHAVAYADLVKSQGASHNHRMYEIMCGNHVDGMLRSERGRQQPVQPYFEAALYHLEDWVERGVEPPASGRFEQIEVFTNRVEELLSVRVKED
jgi:acetyl esterase/lipase